jgi:aerobic-type carbon monoxide dehydrogenase small subunit (CoxS/CutS family)
LMLAVSYQEDEITTIEGLAKDGELQPLQVGFCEEGGAQCGFCTPGMILTAKSFLEKNPEPSDQELREALSGNLCRCTGYTQILASIRRAITLTRARQAEEVGRP